MRLFIVLIGYLSIYSCPDYSFIGNRVSVILLTFASHFCIWNPYNLLLLVPNLIYFAGMIKLCQIIVFMGLGVKNICLCLQLMSGRLIYLDQSKAKAEFDPSNGG